MNKLIKFKEELKTEVLKHFKEKKIALGIMIFRLVKLIMNLF